MLPSPGVEVILGRTSEPWSTDWDDRVSRRHAIIRWNGSRLEVEKLPNARNAIFFRGRQHENFAVAVGEHFVIGQTTFTVLDQKVRFEQADEPVFAEQTFSAHLLRQQKYRDADRRIEVLSKLPEIISGSSSDEELCVRIVNVLLQGIPDASFVAILRLNEVPPSPPVSKPPADENSGSTEHPSGAVADQENGLPRWDSMEPETRTSSLDGADELTVLHWDCRGLAAMQFRPSLQLVRSAIETSESVLHVWNRSIAIKPSFTQTENVDWAFCTPVISDACPGWAIYVAGDFSGPAAASTMAGDADALQDDLKFTELTATTLAALRQVRSLQRRQDSLRNFFAPVVLDALGGQEPDQVLAPRETEVSVLFCDLRGFSKKSEDAADRLLDLLNRVSDALGVMTHHILAGGGVVGDFHGDAAMGFWGWPIASQTAKLHACAAALAIWREFEQSSAQADHPLADFHAGLGIASGQAVAGRIGTADQVKVTVFGPVVNLASRLEGMTKQLQTPILIDEATAAWVKANVPSNEFRVRRVARVLPYGMQTPLVVSELLPPAGENSILSDAHVEAYEAALENFLEGDWSEAFRLLHQVPAEDQVKDFLTVYIAQHRRVAPADWQGVIELPAK